MAKTAYIGARDDYIESSGAQWIDTGITPNQNIGFELDFVPLNSPASSNAPAYINAGGAGGSTGTNLRVGVNVYSSSSTPNGELQLGDAKINNGITPNRRQTISLMNKVASLPNGNTVTLTTADFTASNTLVVFGAHNNSIQRMSSMKLYRLKLYNGSTLVRDFVPAYNNGEYCLYDNVTQGYFYNGSATPLSGSLAPVAKEISDIYVGVNNVARKVIKGYVGVNGVAKQFFSTLVTPLNYIESTGTQYIDTGIYMDDKHSIEMKFRLTGSTPISYEGIFEGYNLSTSSKKVTLMRSGSTDTFLYQLNGTNQDSRIMYANEDITIEATNSSFTKNGSTYTFTAVSYASSNPLTVFRTHDTFSNMRLYYMKIYYEGNLVRDFVPKRNGHIPCLYDNVSQTFFYNQGAGRFLYG